MGLFTYTIAGGAFILIGAWESLSSSDSLTSNPPSPSSSPSTSTSTTTKTTSFSSSITFISSLTLSILVVINSIISLSDAVTVKDHVGSALQLEVITISILFLLYSLLGLLTHITNSIHLPSSILNTLALFAFGEEFWFFYQQRKDPSGIENRYYDLFLVPILICVFSTCLELKNPGLTNARLGRGIGLILQGTWILQMGFSFFSDSIAQGCFLIAKSRGNYTVKCKGHMEYHRGRAIATLQFNVHLALLVTLICVMYSIVCKNGSHGGEYMRYKPLDPEMHQFTLDSDEEEGNEEERSVEMQKSVLMVSESSNVNGYGAH